MPPIDTLKASKRLQEEGTFSPEQAERIAEILSEIEGESPLRSRPSRIASADKYRRLQLLSSRDRDRRRSGEWVAQRFDLMDERIARSLAELKSDFMEALLIGIAFLTIYVSVLGYLLG
jgi:hypothetical protein